MKGKYMKNILILSLLLVAGAVQAAKGGRPSDPADSPVRITREQMLSLVINSPELGEEKTKKPMLASLELTGSSFSFLGPQRLVVLIYQDSDQLPQSQCMVTAEIVRSNQLPDRARGDGSSIAIKKIGTICEQDNK